MNSTIIDHVKGKIFSGRPPPRRHASGDHRDGDCVVDVCALSSTLLSVGAAAECSLWTAGTRHDAETESDRRR